MKIAIARLEEGEHCYEFDFRREDVGLGDGYGYDSDIHLEVRLTKMGDQYLLQGWLKTRANFVCDRCAEPYQADVQDGFTVLFTLSPKMLRGSAGKKFDEIRPVSPGTMEIDLTDDVRQALIVVLPYKKLCSEQCKGLCPHCGANLNFGPCGCQVQTVDPRWEDLKKLLK